MSNKPRLIVVEDNPSISRAMEIDAKRKGFDVDIAETAASAITLLRERHYKAAVVDLQLRDDITHKGGHDVLAYIRRCAEGTAAVVLSGTPFVSDAVKSYDLGVIRLYEKSTMPTNEEILNRLLDAIGGANPTLFGDYPALTNYLAAPEMIPVWEDELRRCLDCQHKILSNVLFQTLNPHLPLLRRSDGAPFFSMSMADKCAYTHFWSKAVGHAVWVSIANNEGTLVEPDGGSAREIIIEKSFREVRVTQWSLVNYTRELYADRVADKPWESGK
ncbi:MAG: response regulator [Nitrospinae bacterium]|nr:response regulator [Nitrospinota bacterium]